VALTLLVGAELLVRSALALQRVDPGFDPRGVLAARVTLPRAEYADPASAKRAFVRMAEELAARPGVQAAATAIPLGAGGGSNGLFAEGEAETPENMVDARRVIVAPAYFDAMRIRLRRGRLLTARDVAGAPRAMVLSEAPTRRAGGVRMGGPPRRPRRPLPTGMTHPQLDMFGGGGPALPDGFRYRPEVLAPADERALVAELRALPFREFEFHGHLGRRRVVSYGWRYDFDAEAVRPADDLPPFLRALRETAAGVAGERPDRLVQALVTEYAPGAGIGWHRDKAAFGDVVGVSLLAPCVFRLRRAAAGGWERRSLTAEPRSAYVLSGAARWEWEHSVPPVGALRYSVTFRALRGGGRA
jgi:alkylated DNA repair dioxygenase AlkB